MEKVMKHALLKLTKNCRDLIKLKREYNLFSAHKVYFFNEIVSTMYPKIENKSS